MQDICGASLSENVYIRLVDVIIRHYSVGMSTQNTISCFFSLVPRLFCVGGEKRA